jgi:hypothetical protein
MQRFTVTGTVPTNSTQIAFELAIGAPSGTAGANEFIQITGVQLEIGSVATNFKRSSGGTIQGELAACQRYYYRASFATNEGLGTANFSGTTAAQVVITMPQQMRSDPAFAAGATNIIVIYTNTAFVSSNITLDTVSNRTVSITATVSGATLGQAGIAYINLNANNFLEFNSEL